MLSKYSLNLEQMPTAQVVNPLCVGGNVKKEFDP